MGLVTLRPNATAMSNGWALNGAPASADVALADNSDATFLSAAQFTGASPYTAQAADALLDMGTFALPALAQVRSITPRLRCARGATGGARLIPVYVTFPGTTVPALATQLAPGTAIATLVGPALAPTGPVSQAAVDAMRVEVGGVFVAPGGTTLASLQVYELLLDVAYNEAPVATVTGPTGTVVANPRPTIAWSVADPEGDAQERYWAKVFTAAQYGAAGFDPDASAAYWDSGEQFGNALSAAVGALLPNGAYRAYAKVADAGSGGRYGAWAFSAFTVAIDQPAAPQLAAVLDTALNRVALTLQGQDNWLTANEASVEVDATGWAADSNVAATYPQRSTAQSLNGSASLLVRSAAAGSMGVRTGTGASGKPVTPGVQVTALASFRAATVGRSCRVDIRWWQASGAASAVRASDSGATVVDATTGWAQASCTATSPADAAYATVVAVVLAAGAASEDHYVDQASIAPGASTTWARGGLTPTQSFIVERSVDGGLTFAEVKRLAFSYGILQAYPLAPASAATQAVAAYDNEAPPRVALAYRARVQAVDAGNALVSANSPLIAPLGTLAIASWWLKDPLLPALNWQVSVTSPAFRRREPQAVFEPLGRATAVVASDGVKGRAGTLGLRALSKADYDTLWALMGSSRTLLLQGPHGQHVYLRTGEEQSFEPHRAADPSGAYPIRHWHELSVPWVEVPAP